MDKQDIGVTLVNITDEDTIPKMPTNLLPKPNEKEYNAKIKDFQIKIEAKLKSIQDLKNERKRLREEKRGNLNTTHQDKNEIDLKVQKLFKEDWYQNTLFIITADHTNFSGAQEVDYQKHRYSLEIFWKKF